MQKITRSLASQAPDGTWACPSVQNPSGLTATDIDWADFAFNPIRAVLTRTVGPVRAAEKADQICVFFQALAVACFRGDG